MQGERKLRADAEGFVLAGGRSSRMGVEKALLPLGGRPLIEHVLGMLREAGLRARIAGARSDLTRYAPIVADDREDGGPLAGVCAALRAASAAWSFITTVDMPLLPATLAVRMLESASEGDGAVLLTLGDGFAQTFPAVLHCELLPFLEAQLKGGYGGTLRAIEESARCAGRQVRVLLLDECGGQVEQWAGDGSAPGEWMLNLNTPEEVKRAEEMLRTKPRH